MLSVVVLRESGRLASFQTYIEKHAEHTQFIKAIYVLDKRRKSLRYSCISSDEFRSILVPIIRQCENLKTLVITAYIDLEIGEPLSRSLRPNNLEFLSFGDTIENLSMIFGRQANLRSLKLSGNDLHYTPTLPLLQALSIKGSGPSFSLSYLSSWAIPSLTTLIIDCETAYIGGQQFEEAISPIAHQLLHLSISAGIVDISIHLILRHCLNLETLNIPLALTSSVEAASQQSGGELIHGKLKVVGFLGLNFVTLNHINLSRFTKLAFPDLIRIEMLTGDIEVVVDAVNRSDVETLECFGELQTHCSQNGLLLVDCTGRKFGSIPSANAIESAI